jgi:alkylation response protein AidB-like acyl-CoA dehydrogenase
VIFPAVPTEEQRAIAASVGGFCAGVHRRQDPRSQLIEPSRGIWRGLADLGVLEHATPDGDGSVGDLVIIAEALGANGFLAPLSEAFAALSLPLPLEIRTAITSGELVVTLAQADETPVRWGSLADVFVAFDSAGGSAWLAHADSVEPCADLSPLLAWGRPRLRRAQALGSGARALAIADVALAAWLAASSERMVRETAEYARARTQFGRSLGSFQAVGHPLAESLARCLAARDLARTDAWRIDAGIAAAPSSSHALVAARAAVMTATYVCQQALGALGYVADGPLGPLPLVHRELCIGHRPSTAEDYA